MACSPLSVSLQWLWALQDRSVLFNCFRMEGAVVPPLRDEASMEVAGCCSFLGEGTPRGMWNRSSLTRGWTCVPCIGSATLNCWTARQVPEDLEDSHFNVFAYWVCHLLFFFFRDRFCWLVFVFSFELAVLSCFFECHVIFLLLLLKTWHLDIIRCEVWKSDSPPSPAFAGFFSLCLLSF